MRAVAAVWVVVVAVTTAAAAALTSWKAGGLTVTQGLQVTLPVVLLALLLTAAGLAATASLGRPEPVRAAPAPARPAPASPASAVDPAPAQQRDSLVRLCVELYDGLDNPALRERLARALAEVGVVAVQADGMVFDPRQHRAIGRVTATDPALHNLVASTERPGYADHGQLLRPADVSVFQVGLTGERAHG
jgi:hypothetical protein